MADRKEYEQKLQKMVQYIEQDGHEKAEEIDVLAEEEYYMEKKAYIESRIGAVKKYYDNLENKYQQQIILDVAKIKSQAYRNILTARNQIVEDVIKSCRERISNLTLPDNKCLYKKVLFQLIAQGLIQMMEPNVILRVRKTDIPLMNKVINQAQNVFNNLTGMKIVISVSENDYLPEKSNGGVVLFTKSKSVSIENTLDSKLDLMYSSIMPYIRKALFGANPNRKHNN